MENTVNREPWFRIPQRAEQSTTISIHDFIDTVRSDRFQAIVQDCRRLKALPDTKPKHRN